MKEAASGVVMLEVSTDVMGSPRIICPTIIKDGSAVVLVDTGFPGQSALAALREALHEAGVSLDRIRAVIITHQDLDHIGGLPGLVEETRGGAEVLAHAAEAPYIQGEKRLLKFPPQAATGTDSLPEEAHKAMQQVFENPPRAKVTRTVEDGEELPYGGGTVIIHTPGHTPGHLCLYVKQAKVLIAGDALNIEEGRLIGPRPQFTADMDSALRSLKKLARYDIETVICYHGGLYSGDANQRIAGLAQGGSAEMPTRQG